MQETNTWYIGEIMMFYMVSHVEGQPVERPIIRVCLLVIRKKIMLVQKMSRDRMGRVSHTRGDCHIKYTAPADP